MNLKYPDDFINKAVNMDCIEAMKLIPDESIHCVVTSPPYWGLRDYGVDGQIGLEKTPEEYVKKMVEVFREVRRILRADGTLWLNLGDSYNGGGRGGRHENCNSKQKTNKGSSTMPPVNISPKLKLKDLVGIPWMVAFALRADGWYLRSDIIWHKPNPMPESVTDRPTKSHEYLFLMTKSQKYYYDSDAIKEDSTTYEERPSGVVRDREYDYDSKQKAMGRHKNLQEKGQQPHSMHLKRAFNGHPPTNYYRCGESKKRNKRSVWTIQSEPFAGAHFATFPTKLIEPCILAGCPKDGIILDPFGGSGTTGQVAEKYGRKWIMIELKPKYIELINKRTAQKSLFKQEM